MSHFGNSSSGLLERLYFTGLYRMGARQFLSNVEVR
jgi:hypothetical protein